MTREQYECLQALRFGLPMSSTWPAWLKLINEGWIAKPLHLADKTLALSEFVITKAGLKALRAFQ